MTTGSLRQTCRHKTLFELLTDPADDRDTFYHELSVAPGSYRDVSGTWMVGRYRLACAVLDHPDMTTRSPVFERGEMNDEAGMLETMLFADDTLHVRMRKTFAPLFSKLRLAMLRECIQADVDALLGQIPDTRRFDVVAHIARRLPALTACRLLGIDVAHAPRLQAQSMAAIRLISAFPTAPAEHAQLVAQTSRFMQEFEPHLTSVRGLLRESPPDGQALTPRQLLANVLLIFIAGYGTTMLSIANTLARALAHRDVWRRLVREPECVPLAIRDLMRIDPAVHVMIRYARADIRLDGLEVGRGDVVAVVAAAANRDPDEFRTPCEVRTDRAHGGLVFGAGSHGCIGAALARMQLGVVFDTLLARMPGLALQAWPQPRLQEGVFRGFRTLLVGDSADA